MALLEVFQTPTGANNPLFGIVTIADDSRIQIVAGTLTLNYYAVGLSYSAQGDIVGGVLTGSDLYDSANGGLQYRITNINLSAVTLYSALLTGDPQLVNQLMFGGQDTILGSPGDDYLAGYGGADSLSGGAGNDQLDGTDDTVIDTLVGGSGNDTYAVGGFEHASNDIVVEAPGADIDLVFSLTSYTLPANVEDLLLLGAGNSSGTGNDLDNAIEGNAGSNLLDGLDGNDTLDGGSGGIDILRGGTGDDSYLVRTGSTLVVEAAGAGTDTVYGEIGWTLGDELENLVLVGVFALEGRGNSLNNVLTGNDAGNLLDGGAGADTLQGGAGNDLFLVDSSFDVVTDVGGDDTVRGSVDGYVLAAPGLENLELAGSAVTGSGNGEANRLAGNALGNLLYGLGGNDTLDGGAGTDTLVGGDGDDSYRVDSDSEVLVELAGGGTDTVFASVSYKLATQVEHLVLTESGATGTGNTLANHITGTAEADTLDGGAGSDTLWGAGGADSYYVDHAGDVIVEASDAEVDTVYSAVSYDLAGAAGVENLTLTGNASIAGTGNAVRNVITGNAGNNLLTAVDGDTVVGGAGQDTLVGSWTSDRLDGGEGADTMAGGFGFDVYAVDDVGDVIQEVVVNHSDRYDLVQAWVSYALVENVEWLTLMGDAAIDGTGTAAGNEILTGNEAANRLNSGGGFNDDLYGMGGDDVLSDGGGYARMYGGAGNDSYEVSGSLYWVQEQAGEGIDTVRANTDFTLGANLENLELLGGLSGTGNAAANLIVGNVIGNFLDGKGGADTLQGGFGDDQYYVDDVGDVVIELDGQGYDSIVSEGISVSLAGKSVERLYLGDNSFAHLDGTGNALDNFIRGTNGNNVLDGGGGADEMYGWLGDDIYVVDDAADQVWEFDGQGNDWVFSKRAAYVLAANVENLRLIEAAAAGTGNGLANLIQGQAGHNLLDGAGGNDTLWGALGDDTLAGGAGNDSLDGDAGSDRAVYGGVRSSYTLSQAAGSITVSGAEGTDVLTGIDAIEFADQIVVLNEHLATGTVAIAGLAKEGQTLTASANASDADGVGVLAYQWFRGTSAIAGAAQSTYQAQAADVGATLSVRVRFVDGAGNTESLWSGSTAAVAAGDHVPPTVQSFSPTDEATGVALATHIVLVFSENIARGSGNIVLKTGAGAVVEVFGAASSRVSVSGSTLTLDPTADFSWDSDYRVELAAGSVADLEGNAYAGTTSYNFRTLPQPDTTPPQVTVFLPTLAGSAVARDSNFLLVFSEDVLRGAGSVVLKTAAGAVVETFNAATSSRLAIDGNTLLIDPSLDLLAGMDYRIEVAAGALVDAAGNGVQASGPYSFSTAASVFSGTSSAELLVGTMGNDQLDAAGGNDSITGAGGNDSINGGAGTDHAFFSGLRADYALAKVGGSFTVADQTAGRDGTDTVAGVEMLRFADRTVDLTMASRIQGVSAADLKTLQELYVGFFNRVPEAEGLGYWIDHLKAGQSLVWVADQFYAAGVQFGNYPASMSDAEFVREIYKNVLGRPPGVPPTDPEVQYWVDYLNVAGKPEQTKGAMVLQMLSDVHNLFEPITDPLNPDYAYHFVADLLNNKAAVANYYAVQQGLSLNMQVDNIAFGIELASLITPTDTSAAIGLIGVNEFSMV